MRRATGWDQWGIRRGPNGKEDDVRQRAEQRSSLPTDARRLRRLHQLRHRRGLLATPPRGIALLIDEQVAERIPALAVVRH